MKVEPIRSNACTVKLLCKIITEIAQKNKDAIDATAAHKIGVIASQLLVSHPLWELVRDEHSGKPPLDELVSSDHRHYFFRYVQVNIHYFLFLEILS